MSEKKNRLDQAAHAAWLSHIAGKTQDEVAQIMGVSRPAAQRLLAKATEAGMVKIRIDHPTTKCLELGAKVSSLYGLEFCRVVPSIPDLGDDPAGVSHELSHEIEKWLTKPAPLTIGFGTGKTLRAAVNALPRIESSQHKVVSLAGNIAPDGSVTKYNVLFSIADKLTAITYSLPMPLIAPTDNELKAVMAQHTIRKTMELGEDCDVAFVGIGELSSTPQLQTDGFLTEHEVHSLRKFGAAGEIIGWAYDKNGIILNCESNTRVASVKLPLRPETLVIAGAKGTSKIPAIKGAIAGKLIDALVTDELTAEGLLAY